MRSPPLGGHFGPEPKGPRPREEERKCKEKRKWKGRILLARATSKNRGQWGSDKRTGGECFRGIQFGPSAAFRPRYP